MPAKELAMAVVVGWSGCSGSIYSMLWGEKVGSIGKSKVSPFILERS